MKTIKYLLFALLVFVAIGALMVTPARHSSASVVPNPGPPRVTYLPDLTVTAVEPVYAGGYGRYIGYLVSDEVWVQVTNQGYGDAGTFGCFFEWDLGYLNEQEFFYLEGGLPAGQSTWVLASANGYNLWAPGHHFLFEVNYDHGINETNYNNNTYSYP